MVGRVPRVHRSALKGHEDVQILLLWADDRSPNLGVRALAEGHAALLHQIWPDATVVAHNFGSRAAPVPMGTIRSAAKELITGRGGMVDWLTGFDLIVDTRSGDSFADIYGLKRLTIMTAMAEAVRRSGTPMALGPQTYGPFESRASVLLAKRALRSADLVMTRDSTSADVLRKLGHPADVITTDVVFALPQPARASGRHDIVFNVSGLLWRGQAGIDTGDYRRTVVDLVEAWHERGREVTLLAHVLAGSPKDSDVDVLADVTRAVGPSVRVVVPKDLSEVRSELAGANVTVGSRMHCCLNSLSVGVPAIPLAYSRKFAPLLADIGWTATVPLRGTADPVAEVLRHTDDDDLPGLVPPVLAAASAKLEVAREAISKVLDRR